MLVALLLLTGGSPHAAAPPPKIGLGISGGGITGLLAAQCQLQFLVDVLPPNLTTATASGGTLGYLVYHSTSSAGGGGAYKGAAVDAAAAKPVTYPPTLNFSQTLEQASSNDVPADTTWWANAINYLRNFSSAADTRGLPEQQVGRRGGGGGRGGAGQAAMPADDSKGWWVDLMETLFSLGYGVQQSSIRTAPSGTALITFAALEASGCPIKRNATSGVMVTAPEYLHTAMIESTNGGTSLNALVGNGLVLSPSSSASPLSLLAASAWSTAFYSASIVESQAQYAAEELAELAGVGLLMTATATVGAASSQEKKKVHLIDGGFVDTTGIVALLQRQTSKIMVFYNNNDELKPAGPAYQETATFAYLFGADVPTDTQNTLGGPKFTKVFPTELYPAVLANLTNPSILFASLKNVPVAVNTWLGVHQPYVLDELLILSNSAPAGFLASFKDPRIEASLSPLWPNRIPVTMSPLDANMLCWYERFKLEMHSDAIDTFFQDK